MGYAGFSIRCGCTCPKCGASLKLEGYSDADGTHYCPRCNDYVTSRRVCQEMTPEKIKTRQALIAAAGALADKLEEEQHGQQ